MRTCRIILLRLGERTQTTSRTHTYTALNVTTIGKVFGPESSQIHSLGFSFHHGATDDNLSRSYTAEEPLLLTFESKYLC